MSVPYILPSGRIAKSDIAALIERRGHKIVSRHFTAKKLDESHGEYWLTRDATDIDHAWHIALYDTKRLQIILLYVPAGGLPPHKFPISVRKKGGKKRDFFIEADYNPQKNTELRERQSDIDFAQFKKDIISVQK